MQLKSIAELHILQIDISQHGQIRVDEVENDHRLCEQFCSSNALTLYALMDFSFRFDTINVE